MISAVLPRVNPHLVEAAFRNGAYQGPMTEMPHPHSPDEVIDPRWTRMLHANAGEGSASASHGSSDHAHLGDEMREIIEPWQAGRRSTRETLKALKDLADDAL